MIHVVLISKLKVVYEQHLASNEKCKELTEPSVSCGEISESPTKFLLSALKAGPFKILLTKLSWEGYFCGVSDISCLCFALVKVSTESTQLSTWIKVAKYNSSISTSKY